MSDRRPFDACVVGHVVLDRNVIGGREQPPQPGGAAFYATVTYARLGLAVAVVTRVAAADEALLLGELRSLDVHVVNLRAPTSTVFRNIDAPEPGVRRVQLVDRQAPVIRASDLPELEARRWHLGPLRHDDLDPKLPALCRRRGGLVGIDVQGLIRRVEDGRVVPRTGHQVRALGPVDVLKADDSEILSWTGCDDVEEAARVTLDAGAAELAITKADRGSILFAGDRRFDIPAYRPKVERDPTGCGDTYLAAYLTRRLETDDLGECGRFAAAVAALKLEHSGAFRGDPPEVARFRSRLDHPQA